MTQDRVHVAIIGAGPYGLSIAAHLRARNVDFRIFGTPMSTWRNHMAGGTCLKSFGFASNLYEPSSSFTLKDFCREQGRPYSDVVDPVTLETFVQYGLEFQRRFVPTLEEADIVSLKRITSGFELTTEIGERVVARHVVVAAGITHFAYTPPVFADLPRQFLTHSSEHTEVKEFAGRTVAVLGGGASAADLAGLLHEAGAEVHWIARRQAIDFHTPPAPEPRPLSQRVLKPRSGLGQGWRAYLCTEYPSLFHALPARFRAYAVQNVNGPAPGWFVKDKVVGRVAVHLGTTMKQVVTSGDRVRLQFKQADGSSKELDVDHVIAATGYKASLERLSFIDPEIRRQVESVEGAPILSKDFESSVRGLYLVGLASMNSFGPLCRFAYGAKFTSSRIARHLARNADNVSICKTQTQTVGSYEILTH